MGNVWCCGYRINRVCSGVILERCRIIDWPKNVLYDKHKIISSLLYMQNVSPFKGAQYRNRLHYAISPFVADAWLKQACNAIEGGYF